MKIKAIITILVIAIMAVFAGVVSAQEDDTTSTDRPNRPHALRVIGADVLEVVSEATGLTNVEILQQVRDGSTLAEVIGTTDADLDTVIEDVTTALTERIETALAEDRITQERADEMLENLPTLVDTTFNTVPDFENRRGRGDGNRNRAGNLTQLIVFDAVMEATDLSLLDLMTALGEEGTTLADIVTENGADVDTVISDIIATITEEVNIRVEDGTLTQEQADNLLENLEERLIERFNGELRIQGFGGERGRSNR
ncbi:MAG: hypothetical protein AAFQ07_08370 [Chloroflexota bacterium]